MASAVHSTNSNCPMRTSLTLTADRRVKAETKVKSGQGDKGDR